MYEDRDVDNFFMGEKKALLSKTFLILVPEGDCSLPCNPWPTARFHGSGYT
jgi:hypothetical protein